MGANAASSEAWPGPRLTSERKLELAANTKPTSPDRASAPIWNVVAQCGQGEPLTIHSAVINRIMPAARRSRLSTREPILRPAAENRLAETAQHTAVPSAAVSPAYLMNG